MPHANYTSNSPDVNAIQQFLDWFRPDGPWLLHSIAVEGGAPDGHTFHDSDEAASWAADRNQSHNIYFSVNPTKTNLNKKAAKDDLLGVDWCHNDVDPRNGVPIHLGREDREFDIEMLDPEPSLVIDSGRGFWVFWRLDERTDVKTGESINKAFAVDLELEDSCYNADRIARLPGCINWPTQDRREAGAEPALATVIDQHDTIYSIDDLPKLHQGNISDAIKQNRDPYADFIRGHDVHGSACILVGQMLYMRMSDEAIISAFKGYIGQAKKKSERSDKRYDTLKQGELRRMIDGGRKKGFDRELPINPLAFNVFEDDNPQAAKTIERIFASTGKHHVNLPDSIQNTVIGKTAVSVARATEMPLATVLIPMLACASAAAATNFRTGYFTGSALPIGIYTVAEQMPSAQKSRVINNGTMRYKRTVGAHNAEITRANHDRELPLPRSFSVVTDPTAAGLDQQLSSTDSGRFFIASAEQGAFVSLFPQSGSYSSNNDLMLAGWSGDYVSASRKSRESFTGQAQGSVVMFAQPGAIGRVLNESNGSGLTERFLFVAEPDNLGNRTFPNVLVDDTLYEAVIDRCINTYAERFNVPDGEFPKTDLESLTPVVPSESGYKLVREERLRIEQRLPELRDNGELTFIGWLGKAESHILKMAATLHLFDELVAPLAETEGTLIIPDSVVQVAIDTFNALAEHYRGVLNDNGEAGVSAEAETVLNAVAEKPVSKAQLIQKIKRRKPFRSRGGGNYAASRDAIDSLLAEGVLILDSRKKVVAVV